LEGCLNFRDLGGYPTEDGRTVRWRRLFRSDALHLVSGADVRRLRDELGIAEVIDLRSSAELRLGRHGLLAQEPIRFHHVPLFDGEGLHGDGADTAASLADYYLLLAEVAKAPICKIITTCAETDGAVVYHCAAGKDRTGVVSAVLLGILGVVREAIVADYAATQESLDAIIARLMATAGYRSMFEVLPPDTLHAEPETMNAFIEGMCDRYGSMRAYARDAGVSDAALCCLEERLLVA